MNRGHNNPPELLELSQEVIRGISDYMAQAPVVETESEARDAKLQIDRAKLCLKDLEDERDTKVRPLNEQVAAINLCYRKPKDMLSGLLNEMSARVHRFIAVEEAKRRAIAAEKERIAREAEEAALEAERLERERLDDAANGELGVDVAEVIAAADASFEEFQRARRDATVSLKESKLRVRSVLGGRASGLRDKEVFEVIDAIGALIEMGVNEIIKAEIIKSAKAYRKLHNKLPKGVQSTTIGVFQ